MEYRIVFSVQAQKLFTEIKDRREQSVILKRIEKLKDEPEKQGKALSEELLGYRSIRSVGQRYRIIYRIEQDRVVELSWVWEDVRKVINEMSMLLHKI